MRTPSASASASVPPANSTVIDLTLSDSEDEEEPQYFRQPDAGMNRDFAADSTRQSQPPKLPEIDSGARLNFDHSRSLPPPLPSTSSSHARIALVARSRDANANRPPPPDVDINPLDMDYGIPTRHGSYSTDQWVNPDYRSGRYNEGGDGSWGNPGTINPSANAGRTLERWSDVREPVREGKRPRPTASEWMDDEFTGDYRIDYARR